MEVKPDAVILDPTAGNRGIWKRKDSKHVLFIDVEPDLTVKPDMFIDCRDTGFPAGRFRQIMFDPPHRYGHTKNTGVHQTPSRELQMEKWGNTGAYYGFDKYKTKADLMRFISDSQREFYRILEPQGILMMKWAEIHASLEDVLNLFVNWRELMRFEVAYRGEVRGARTWWVMLMKSEAPRQLYLTGDESRRRTEQP